MSIDICGITDNIIDDIYKFHSCYSIKDKVYIIKLDGQRLQFRGKKCWSSIGAAKNAMRLHIGDIIDIWVDEGFPINEHTGSRGQECKNIKEQIYQDLLKNRIVIEEL